MIIVTVAIASVCQIAINMAIRSAVNVARHRVADHRAQQNRAGRILREATGVSMDRAMQRTATVGSLLRSLSAFIIWFVAVLVILSGMGIALGPILASASVLGVALGFGAQSLIKDFLAGICMITEDQFGVGDYVNLGEVEGTVEEVGLRVTRIRDMAGKVWYIRNGEVTKVGNLSQGWSTAMVDLPVAYRTDATMALQTLQHMVDGLDMDASWAMALLERPEVLGVADVSGVTMTLRIMIKTLPNQHWAISRYLRERAMQELADAGIKGPQPMPWLQPTAPDAPVSPWTSATNQRPLNP